SRRRHTRFDCDWSSDVCSSDLLKEFENKALPLIYHRVGKRVNNLGITALDVKANPENASQRAIYASVANFSTNSQHTELELLSRSEERRVGKEGRFWWAAYR